ncbi:MAG: hypothetical protein ABR599_08010 [Gemmatimonadota bacterium]
MRFRAFDGPAREALESLLARMPVAAAGAEDEVGLDAAVGAEPSSGAVPARPCSAADLMAEVERLLAEASPLRSPLAFHAAQLREGELRLVQAQLVAERDPDALPRWEERELVRVRRLGQERYKARRAAHPPERSGPREARPGGPE